MAGSKAAGSGVRGEAVRRNWMQTRVHDSRRQLASTEAFEAAQQLCGRTGGEEAGAEPQGGQQASPVALAPGGQPRALPRAAS